MELRSKIYGLQVSEPELIMKDSKKSVEVGKNTLNSALTIANSDLN